MVSQAYRRKYQCHDDPCLLFLTSGFLISPAVLHHVDSQPSDIGRCINQYESAPHGDRLTAVDSLCPLSQQQQMPRAGTIHTLSLSLTHHAEHWLLRVIPRSQRSQKVEAMSAMSRDHADGLSPRPARLSRALALPQRHCAGSVHRSYTSDKRCLRRRERPPAPPRWRSRGDNGRDCGSLIARGGHWALIGDQKWQCGTHVTRSTSECHYCSGL